jgi:uncharacterized phage infection (PIP) family protein YhgE
MKELRGLPRPAALAGIAALVFRVMATPAFSADRSSQLPAGYKLYEQNFENSAALQDFVMTDPPGLANRKEGRAIRTRIDGSKQLPASRSFARQYSDNCRESIWRFCPGCRSASDQ